MIKETHIIRGTIYSLEELAEMADGVLVREKEEKEMTKTMEKMVGRIYEELSKWCAERGVVYEYNFSTDDGESCTFITPDTTLTVNHVENRDPEQFSKYVKNVLFGVDESAVIDKLKEEINKKDAYIGRLEKEDKEKAKDIEYLEKELKNLRDEKDNCKYWLNVRATKISEISNDIEEKEKNLKAAADKIIQLKCTNTSLNEQIDMLRCSLNKEREGYGELKDQYDDKCKAFINMCKLYDTEVTKRMKAEEELEKLKAGRHDDTVDVMRYLVVLGKKKRAEEKIRSLKSQVEICEDVVKNLAAQNESFKKQVDALVKEKLKILAEDDATMDILKKKNATLQYKVDALENDVKSLTFSYKKELEKKEKENLDLDNNVKDMWATLRSLKKENAGLKDANSFLSIKLEKHNEIIEALKSDNDEAEAKIEDLLEKNYNLDNHVKNLVAQNEVLEREKGEITNELNNVVDNYDKSAISLKKEVLRKDDEIRALKQDIVELNDKKNNIINKLNDESRRLVLEKKKSSAFEQEIDRLLGLCKDKVDDVSSFYPSDLVKVKEFVKDDTLKDIKERISWILTHMNNAEIEADKRFKKLEDGSLFVNDMLAGISVRLDNIDKYYTQVNHCLTDAYNRICKLEDAQPKESAKKTSKKSQKSTLS